MKKTTVTLTTILCIALATGCKNQQQGNAGNTEKGGPANVCVNATNTLISKDSAANSIFNYGGYCGFNNIPKDHSTVAWLVSGSDFLHAMGLEQGFIDTILSRAQYTHIHEYIGLPQYENAFVSVDPYQYTDPQLYIVGAQCSTSGISDNTNAVYNLTMPCPSACSNIGDVSLNTAFDSGYDAGQRSFAADTSHDAAFNSGKKSSAKTKNK